MPPVWAALASGALAVAMLVGAPPLATGSAAIHGPTRTSAMVAKIVIPTGARAAPGRRRVATWLETRAPWGKGPTQLLILGSARDPGGRLWLRVRLPIRPNRSSGWVLADRARVLRSPWRIVVRRSRREVSVYRKGRLTRRFRAVVGAPTTPTPLGLFALYEKIRQPDSRGFLGPWALHLTAHSNVLDDYGGGPGRVALHGREGMSLRDPLGSASSHGCVRINNHQIRWLARVAIPGTPVSIRR